MCVNNDISQWRCLGRCEHITSIHFEKSHCCWQGSTKKSNKIALYEFKWPVQQLPWQSYVARPYDVPGAYQCSVVAGAYNWNIEKRRARHMAWVRKTIPCNCCCSSSSYMAAALKY